jgi:general secretion pathway protein G
MRALRNCGGYTFIELVVATGVIMVLASAALPLARVSMQRQREVELHRALREMRAAIDRFKDSAHQGVIASTELQIGSENYPMSLQQLVDGVTRNNDATGTKWKLLRRIPIDPMTGQADWGLRAMQDQPDASVWGGMNVFDVYSKAPGVALDGSKYRDW